MINLIPPAAKTKIRLEYWARVGTVWFSLWGLAVLAGAALLFPTKVLITGQVDALSAPAESVAERVASYELVSDELDRAGQLARVIVDQRDQPTLAAYLALLSTYADDSILISQFVLTRSKDGIAPAQITGVAADRLSLASFKDRLEADERIAVAKLPISNLAEDSDISFTIQVEFNNDDV